MAKGGPLPYLEGSAFTVGTKRKGGKSGVRGKVNLQ